MNHGGRGVGRAGASLVELLITIMIFVTLIAGAFASLNSMMGLAKSADASARLQSDAQRALGSIARDMRNSGLVTVGTVAYPGFFLDGNPAAPFGAHVHAAPIKSAAPGDADFGPNREIVFALPADADGDRRPDVDAAGAAVWDAREFSYVVVADAEGRNHLERRIDAASPVRLASDVERLVFDDTATDPSVPFGAVRVRIFFRAREAGRTIRQAAETTVRLRNS
jgi:type II secretory pathway pseudopilin PulG